MNTQRKTADVGQDLGQTDTARESGWAGEDPELLRHAAPVVFIKFCLSAMRPDTGVQSVLERGFYLLPTRSGVVVSLRLVWGYRTIKGHGTDSPATHPHDYAIGVMYSETPLSWGATLWRSRGGALGLRFAAGTAAKALPLAVGELCDELVPLRDVAGTVLVDRFRAWFHGLGSDVGSASIPPNLGTNRETLGWTQAVFSSLDRGSPAPAIALELNWSQRHFRRQMIQHFGYGYSTLVRIDRARRARSMISQGTSLSAIPAHIGYADQPHLTREFRRFVGATPGQLAISFANRSMELPSGSRRVA